VRGLIAGDTALHACAGGDLLPTVTMGIPGSGAMAVLLAAFALHGISPGPQVIRFRIDLIYLIIFVLFFAHCISVGLAVAFSHFMEKLTKLEAEILSPVIIVLCLIGSYVTREDWQDMLVATVFGFLGYYMKKYGYHPIPLVLGIVLGPIAEKAFFQTITHSKNGILIFFTRIPSLIIFLCVMAVIFWPYIERLYKKTKTSAL
jgi:putative tricarboxylic transport membrane protein